jgi:hypothetical protein
VDVEVAMLVGQADFLGVFLQGVARLHRAGEVQHEALKAVAHVGILGNAPVALVQVLVDGLLDVEEGLLLIPKLAALSRRGYTCAPRRTGATP